MTDNKPENIKGEKGLQVSIWDNDGRKSVQLSKRYKSKQDDSWKEQKIVFFDDLEAIDSAINLLQQAKAKLQE